MDSTFYQQVANKLLQRHYGIGLEDTHLSNPVVVEACIRQNRRPFEAVNGHAEECDLVRIDRTGAWGIPESAPITHMDEEVMIAELVIEAASCGRVVPVRNERYAESIIGNSPERYDAIEIHGVRDLGDQSDLDGTNCTIDDADPQFFSVYVHVVNDGVDCVGDFDTHLHAKQYADDLSTQYGWKVVDYSSNVRVPA